jgi:hypothetical protein
MLPCACVGVPPLSHAHSSDHTSCQGARLSYVCACVWRREEGGEQPEFSAGVLLGACVRVCEGLRGVRQGTGWSRHWWSGWSPAKCVATQAIGLLTGRMGGHPMRLWWSPIGFGDLVTRPLGGHPPRPRSIQGQPMPRGQGMWPCGPQGSSCCCSLIPLPVLLLPGWLVPHGAMWGSCHVMCCFWGAGPLSCIHGLAVCLWGCVGPMCCAPSPVACAVHRCGCRCFRGAGPLSCIHSCIWGLCGTHVPLPWQPKWLLCPQHLLLH